MEERRESVCVCNRERERERVCVCLRERERERWREEMVSEVDCYGLILNNLRKMSF
jgi:hypothetical protein